MSGRKAGGSQKGQKGRSLRSRNIDNNLQLRIITVPDEEMKDAESQKKSKSMMKDIPTPKLQVIQHSMPDRGRRRFVLPEHYIKFKTHSIAGSLLQRDHYVLTQEDFDWLNEANQPPKPLNCGGKQMESLILWLEQKAWRSGCCEADPREHVHLSLARGAVDEFLGIKEFAIDEIYYYWVSKRIRLKKALVRKLQIPPSPTNDNPNVAFRRRTLAGDKHMSTRHRSKNPRKNDRESYKRMLLLKQDLTKLRLIVQLVKSREEWKHQQLLVESEMIHYNIVRAGREAASGKVKKNSSRSQTDEYRVPLLLPKTTFNDQDEKWNIEKILAKHKSEEKAVIPWSNDPYDIAEWLARGMDKSSDETETEEKLSDEDWSRRVVEAGKMTDKDRVLEVLDAREQFSGQKGSIHFTRTGGEMIMNSA